MDNFTKFPNDIYDALLSRRFHAMEITVILYIIRKTCGWGKAADVIAIAKMARDTGYNREAMIRTIQHLEERNIISVQRAGAGRMSQMMVNGPDKWKQDDDSNNKPVTHKTQCPAGHRGSDSQVTGGVTSRSQVPVTYRSHTKEIKNNLNNNKESAPPPPADTGAAVATDATNANADDWTPSELPDDVWADDSLWK